MDPLRQVPARIIDKIRVLGEEEYGILGYVGDILEYIVNRTGKPIQIVLVLGPSDQRSVFLDVDQQYDINLDVTPVIRGRCVPYVKTTETIVLDVAWKFL